MGIASYGDTRLVADVLGVIIDEDAKDIAFGLITCRRYWIANQPHNDLYCGITPPSLSVMGSRGIFVTLKYDGGRRISNKKRDYNVSECCLQWSYTSQQSSSVQVNNS